MEMQQLNDWIKNPDMLGNETLDELRSLISRYPYFQTAWLLYLKNLYILQSPSFKDELRRGALFVADLSVLFYYIEGNRYAISKYNDSASADKPSGTDRTLDLIDRFLSEIPNDKGFASELSIPVDSVMDYSSLLLLNPGNQGRTESDDSVNEPLPLRGQQLIDSFIEKSESGKISNDMSVAAEELVDSEDFYEAADEHDENGVQDEPESGESVENDYSADGAGDEYLTETLAKIYVKQQRYDKALEIIKKLNLKYPKKNIYFADQIRYLERLIINAKSK